MAEKLERKLHFLLMVTEVDLASSSAAYTVALPSQLTNVAVLSIKRLDPGFWGKPDDEQATVEHLTTLLLHSFGHLLNLRHSTDTKNIMFDFGDIDELREMQHFDKAQRKQMRRTLPQEAHELKSRGGFWKHAAFALRTGVRRLPSIVRALVRANPLRLLRRLPTMVTAAFSVLIVLFFSAEPWDVGSSLWLWQLIAFSILAVIASSLALYRTFSVTGLRGRGRTLAESSVVTALAVALSLLLTMTTLLVVLAGVTFLASETVFPRALMETWPTVDPAVRALDHIKVALFLASFATLAGSLGGAADQRDLVRGVLFVDEES